MFRLIGKPKQLITMLLNLNQDTVYEIREHKEKRTLSQNAYYYVLLGQLAGKLHMSKPELHNRMLRSYGQIEIFGGKAARLTLPDTEETEAKAIKSETVHLRPTSQTITLADGVTYRTYVLLKGSSALNTAEMAQLLDGLIEECRQCDIQTLTPRELAEMRMIEERRNAKHHTA